VPKNDDLRAEQRKEPRYATDDLIEVGVLPHLHPRLSGKILNVSRSGLQLELRSELHPGTEIQVMTRGKLVVFGEVRYCRQSSDVFHIGVRIQDAVVPALDAEKHLHEDELSLYIRGHGLTAAGFVRTKKHLERCPECRKRLTETSNFMDQLEGKLPPA
jgi:hypothetical protein